MEQIKKDDLCEFARDKLSGILNRKGGILYSSHETLKKGDVYLLGFNPGGDPNKNADNTIENSIKSMLKNKSNSYLDESWENKNRVMAKGEAPLQKRVQWVLENIGYDLRKVCASNLIFVQSRDIKSLKNRKNLAEQCWPVHEAIISIIKPKVIIAIGNGGNESPYIYLQGKWKETATEVEYLKAGHKDWNLKGFSCEINNHPVYVAGLPHLSRYSPEGKKQVIDWLKSKINKNQK